MLGLLAGVTALAALPGAATAACSAPAPSSSSSTAGSAQADPQVAQVLLDAAVADEWLMVARYEAAIAAHPDLQGALAPVLDQHAKHAAALGSQRPEQLPPAGTMPASRSRTIALLAAAESAACDQRIDACVGSSEPVPADGAEGTGRARLLASIAASEASHAQYLAGL